MDVNTGSAGIALPSAFSPTTPDSLRAYVGACLEFLMSPLVNSLLECHPNDIAVNGPRSEWLPWWSWAAHRQTNWTLLVPGWIRDDDEIHLAADIPLELTQMLGTIDTLALPRTFEPNSVSSSLPPIRGMSAKKSHEVSEMSAYIASLLSRTSSGVSHAVDVGAGQGYLSRALSEHPHSMNVLALDFSEVQTQGAERRGRNIKKKRAKSTTKKTMEGNVVHTRAEPVIGRVPISAVSPTKAGIVTHEMIHINPRTLEDSVTSWISTDSSSSETSSPVLLVALHACGSLTPDILRCYVACRDKRFSRQDTPRHNWYPTGLVVVGCCYNLMSPESDFPMSRTVSNETRRNNTHIVLSYNHRSLAAQSPSQWGLNASTQSAAELAIRKVVFRALLGKQAVLATANSKNSPERREKVGRLHDSAYTSLQTFISRCNQKNNTNIPIPAWGDVQSLASCLEVLHVLRSRIGPVVESIILVDRWLYLAENLPTEDVLTVNLFDQARGSARNVALVVRPR